MAPPTGPLSPFLFLIAAKGPNVMMQVTVVAKLFAIYKVGIANGVLISHLKSIDDTLFTGKQSWANTRSFKAILIIFEEISNLKVYFN
jgi:hypothetical protein